MFSNFKQHTRLPGENVYSDIVEGVLYLRLLFVYFVVYSRGFQGLCLRLILMAIRQ